MHVAVCDDEKVFREHLKQHLTEYSFQTNRDIKISEYDDGETLLEAYSGGALWDMDILFLDIRMGEMDGMEAARRLRNGGCQSLIVFLTSLPEYLQKGYEVKAFRYLLKEQGFQELKRIMDACVGELETDSYFLFSWERCRYSIPKKEILYFESRKRLVFLYTAAGSWQFYQKLDELEKQLEGEGFLRCHRSFLVQERYVKGWRDDALWLEDGRELPVSRTYRKRVNQRLMRAKL